MLVALKVYKLCFLQSSYNDFDDPKDPKYKIILKVISNRKKIIC